MKRYLFLIAMILFAISCGKAPINNPDVNPDPKPTPGPHAYIENGKNLGDGIAILGDWDLDDSTPNTTLYWAPVNCGYEEVGEIGDRSDHRLGKLYQWGAGDSSLPYMYNGLPVVARAMYFEDDRPTPWYIDASVICGTTSDKWNNNQGPCPKGWRLPTLNEISVLGIGYSSEWIDDKGGIYADQADVYSGKEFFGKNVHKTPGTGVFFPAAGCAYGAPENGFPREFGFSANYWSSTPHESNPSEAYMLSFFRKDNRVPLSNGLRASACSVRCVSE